MLQRYLQNQTPLVERRSLVDTLLGDKIPYGSTSHLNSRENVLDWTWDPGANDDFVSVMNDNRDVQFHRNHSSGTAVVRGSEPMSMDQHFWEIEMVTPIYGTDMMVGVGTPEADMSQLPDMFVSRLGKDDRTWGFSYTGSFYHNSRRQNISSPFDQGSIIGVHLDMWNGTLSFYKNKKHLGIACKGLKGKTLYAMASSTAACSVMRIKQSCSFPSSLQFLCCARLRELIPDDKCVIKALDIPPGLKIYLKNNLSWLLNPRLIEDHPFLSQFGKGKRDIVWPTFFYTDNIFEFPEPAPTNTRERIVNFILAAREDHCLFHNVWQRPRREHPSPERNVLEPTGLTDEDLSEDHSDSTENERKRRKYSYNYAMGLSDPDSDTD